MKHLTRDFLTLPLASCPGTNMYVLAAFLVHCGGFRFIGQTNFDMMTSSITLGEGISGSINTLGTYEVVLPSSSYQVTANDVNRILALTSVQNPKSNSGLFRVSSVDLVNNGLVVDYRSAASPPVETNLAWRVFENEVSFSLGWRTGSNGTPGYNSRNNGLSATSSASRIALQAPDASNWQLRMCLESAVDQVGAASSGFSIAPGFAADDAGDFSPFSDPIDPKSPGTGQRLFLHGAMWYDTQSALYRGMTVGLSPASASLGQWRISMMVDDVSGSASIVNQNVSLVATAGSGSGWCAFGLTDDESWVPPVNQSHDPTLNVRRLFVAGSSNVQSNLTWRSQFHNDNHMQVVGWSPWGRPVPGVLSLYCDISNPGNTQTRYLSSSVDSPWIAQTELLDVDVMVGTIDVTLSSTTTGSLYPFMPRRIGRLPSFMQGRANYANWTVTGDGGWYHTVDGVFMEWGGPVPTGNAVTSSAYPTFSIIEDQESLIGFGASLPGSDPIPVGLPPAASDVDATRYRKTYSWFRQVPVTVSVVKGGSNPSKP